MCQAAKSRRAIAQFAPVVLDIEEQFPDHVWLYLTITVKNVPATELRNAFTGLLNPGMSRLSRRKAWPAIGWTVAREVTRGTKGDAHPHLHVLMLVPSEYLSTGYMQQSEWVDLVQDAFKLNYKPSIRISRVQGKDGLHKAVLETFKYTVKSQDLVGDRSWCLTVTDQMHGLRARSHGGVFKQLLAAVSDEETDLEDADEFEHLWFTPDPEAELTFLVWNHRQRSYVQVDQPQPCHMVPYGTVEKWWIRDNPLNSS
uniref:Replication protein n=1 Tax=uncultured prokaryote TaxID=198431 RepID=A0A0H5QG51_9ZZZZ|nr:hypothetical protein [uncultured prokaryote]